MAREGTRCLEGLDLLLRSGQPCSQLSGLLRVLGLARNGEVGAAPVASATREGVCDSPLACILLARAALDHTEHPGRARLGGEGALLEPRVPLIAEGGKLR